MDLRERAGQPQLRTPVIQECLQLKTNAASTALRERSYQVVEGAVTDFVPLPYPGRAQEKLLAAAAPSIAPSCTSDKTFVDTDVLVYAHDIDHSVKRDRARAALRGLLDDGTGVVSPQVLQAFYVSVTRKIAQPPPIDEARSVVEVYAF